MTCPSELQPVTPAPAAAFDRVEREAVAAALRARLSAEAVVRVDEPLARRTTLRVGGPADWFVEPASEVDLAEVLRFCAARALPWRVLGRGSNLLVKDGGVRGVVVSLGQPAWGRIRVLGGEVHAGAGARLKEVAAAALRHGLGGLEFFEGIPGSVGGALRMNAGAFQSWTFAVLDRLRWMLPDGAIEERSAAKVPARYRGCPSLARAVALGAVFRGRRESPEVIRARMNDYSRRRWETQPREPSAGCLFKNPPALPAGRLIEELGLKGTAVGGARVSEVHGNFIVTRPGARAREVLELLERLQAEAREQRGITLEPEVEIWGED